MRIGIYDSGIGGFSILNRMIELMPSERYFYFADNKYAPYGERGENFLCERGVVALEELRQHQVEIVVVACNTATAATIDQLRRAI